MTEEQLLDFCNKKWKTSIDTYIPYDSEENIKARFCNLHLNIARNRTATIMCELDDVTHEVVVYNIILSEGNKTFCANNGISDIVQTDEEICKFIVDTIDTYKSIK